VSGNPVFDPAGRFLGYRGTARNITEEVLAERSLRTVMAAAEAKYQFLVNMNHVLRTHLNSIQGFAELLECGGGGPLHPKGKEYAGLIHQSGAYLLDVINELVVTWVGSAPESWELQEERGIDPRRLVEQCVKLVQPQADAAALHLSAEIADPVPLLVADRTRLTQILFNLLSNAIKFSEPGGSVSIAMRRRIDGQALLEVSDTGIGRTIPSPLARRLAEMHGGSLQIRSGKGAGTTATLLLPASRVLDDRP
jgi:signal transduction histidine kinase